jgi:hypothetical protein
MNSGSYIYEMNTSMLGWVAALLNRDLDRSQVIFLALTRGQEIDYIHSDNGTYDLSVDTDPWGHPVYEVEIGIRNNVWYNVSSVWKF